MWDPVKYRKINVWVLLTDISEALVKDTKKLYSSYCIENYVINP